MHSITNSIAVGTGFGRVVQSLSPLCGAMSELLETFETLVRMQCSLAAAHTALCEMMSHSQSSGLETIAGMESIDKVLDCLETQMNSLKSQLDQIVADQRKALETTR